MPGGGGGEGLSRQAIQGTGTMTRRAGPSRGGGCLLELLVKFSPRRYCWGQGVAQAGAGARGQLALGEKNRGFRLTFELGAIFQPVFDFWPVKRRQGSPLSSLPFGPLDLWAGKIIEPVGFHAGTQFCNFDFLGPCGGGSASFSCFLAAPVVMVGKGRFECLVQSFAIVFTTH